jgi:hypothetical protein
MEVDFLMPSRTPGGLNNQVATPSRMAAASSVAHGLP